MQPETIDRVHRGRPPTRYMQFLAYLRVVMAEEGRAPSYGRTCAALGVGDRSNVRKLVIYGIRRGHLSRADGVLRAVPDAPQRADREIVPPAEVSASAADPAPSPQPKETDMTRMRAKLQIDCRPAETGGISPFYGRDGGAANRKAAVVTGTVPVTPAPCVDCWRGVW